MHNTEHDEGDEDPDFEDAAGDKDDAGGEEDQGEDADEGGDDGANDEAQKLLEVLTVTAKKLSGVTLGRKLTERKPPQGGSSRPMRRDNRSIEDRKAAARCSDCDDMGHWAGDAECKKPGPGAARKQAQQAMREPADRNVHTSESAQTDDAHTVSAVTHHHSGLRLVHMQTHDYVAVPSVSHNQRPAIVNDSQHRVHETHAVEAQDYFFVCVISHLGKSQDDQAVRDDTPIDGAISDIPYQIGLKLHEISMVNVEYAAGFMVIDTACQRNCHGVIWRIVHDKILTKFGLA